MDVPTRSNRERNGRAALALLLGLLAAACVPAAIVGAHFSDLDLIQAGWAVPPAFLLGTLAVFSARSARRRIERTIGRVGGDRSARVGRILGGLGIYLALAGALALAVYYLLDYLSA